MQCGNCCKLLVIGFTAGLVAVARGGEGHAQSIQARMWARGQLASLAHEGRHCSDEEAAQLEALLKEQPDDLAARTKLLGRYWRSRRDEDEAGKRYHAHCLWVIAHRPETSLAGSLYAKLDPISASSAYQKARKLWQNHVQAHPDDVRILGNAAAFFRRTEEDTAEKLLRKAEAVDADNALWPQQLGELYWLRAAFQRSADRTKLWARKSLAAYERALARTAAPLRPMLLMEAARAAYVAGKLDVAERLATELLEGRTRAPLFWLSSASDALHRGHTVLGLVALQRDDVQQAEEHLLHSARVSGSPALGSFGPNMHLAHELLEKGRQETVIEYLQKCGEFWKTEQTEAWIKLIKAGQTPDFGANLRY